MFPSGGHETLTWLIPVVNTYMSMVVGLVLFYSCRAGCISTLDALYNLPRSLLLCFSVLSIQHSASRKRNKEQLGVNMLLKDVWHRLEQPGVEPPPLF